MRASRLTTAIAHRYPALRYPHFARLLLAAVISGLGSQFTVLALSVAVFSATGSVASLAGIWVVRVLSRLLMQPFIGALADRLDRRNLLVTGYLFSALLSVGLILITIEPLLVYPVVFLIQTVDGLVGPAMGAIVPSLVPKEALVSANALKLVLGKITAALGPALAGLLYNQTGPFWLFIFDAITFLGVACALMTLPPLPSRSPNSSPNSKLSLWNDARDGLRFALSRRAILIILILSMLTSLFWRVVEIVLVPISVDVTDIGAEGLGFLYASLALGGAVGVTVLGAIKKSVPRLQLVILLNSVLAFPMVIGATFPVFTVLLAMFFISGILFDISNVAVQSIIQFVVPQNFLARIFSLMNVSLALGVLPVLVMLDPLVQWLGPLTMLQLTSLTVCGLGFLIYVTTLLSKSLKYQEESSL